VREGRAAGLGENRLRGPDLARHFHGVRGDGPTLAHAYAPLLRPGDRFSHVTAAELWGLPLPRSSGEIHVTATLPSGRPRTAGVQGHVGGRDLSVLREGLPVSAPPALLVELALTLSIDDLVAVGDALVLEPYVFNPRDPRPWVSLDALRAEVSGSRSPGSRLARRALALNRAGAESRAETHLRLVLGRAGFPEPELNADIRDAQRRWIGRFDIVYREERVIVEYDGDQHRTSTAQYEKDIDRIERVQAAGWVVVRVRARGLLGTPHDTIARVRVALTR